MALPATGGLNQISAQNKQPAPAVGKFDPNAAQAENLEEISKSKPTGLKEKIVDDLGEQREAMNAALLRMRESLDIRKNRMFDPVLMQTAAGFLKPTKTGSFGESLGNAAENAGVAAEQEMLRQRENQKLEMELLGKEQEFRQQLGGDTLMSVLLGGPKTGGAPSPAGATAPSGAVQVAGTTPSIDLKTQEGQQEVVAGVRQGRIKVTDEILAIASRVAPKMLPFLQEMRKSQTEEEKNEIARATYEGTTRKVKPLGLDTEREMDRAEYAEYQRKVNEANSANDEQILLRYYKNKGWLEKNQLEDSEPAKEGEPPKPIPRAKSAAQIKAEEETQTATAKARAEASEARGNAVLARGENAPRMEALASDVLSLTDSNTRAFNLMQDATVRDSVLRAIEQGASVTVGPMTVALNLPARVILQGNKEYKLTKEDIVALQIFQQKQSEITAEMRRMGRTPGEGATDKAEGQLYAALGILPSDSAQALALKSEAMIQYARYNARAAELWSQYQDQFPNKSFTYFQQNNPDFKELQKNYVRTLNEMREKNADVLRTSPKKNSSSTNQSSAGDRKPPAGWKKNADGTFSKE